MIWLITSIISRKTAWNWVPPGTAIFQEFLPHVPTFQDLVLSSFAKWRVMRVYSVAHEDFCRIVTDVFPSSVFWFSSLCYLIPWTKNNNRKNSLLNKKMTRGFHSKNMRGWFSPCSSVPRMFFLAFAVGAAIVKETPMGGSHWLCRHMNFSWNYHKTKKNGDNSSLRRWQISPRLTKGLFR